MKTLLAFIFFLSSAYSYAGPKVTTTIESIRVRPHVSYIMFEGCQKWSLVYLDSEYRKAMISVALVAGSANKEVEVQYEHDDGCNTTESELTYLQIKF